MLKNFDFREPLQELRHLLAQDLAYTGGAEFLFFPSAPAHTPSHEHAQSHTCTQMLQSGVLLTGSRSIMAITLRTCYIQTGLGGLMTQEFEVWYAIKGHPCNAAMGVCVCVSARVYVCMLCHAHTHTCMHQSTKWANHPATDLLLPLCLLLRVRRCERHRLDGVHFQRTLIHVSSVGLQLRIATLLKGLRVFLRAMNTSSFNILSTTVLFFPYFFSNTNTPNTDQEAPLVVHHGLERAHIRGAGVGGKLGLNDGKDAGCGGSSPTVTARSRIPQVCVRGVALCVANGRAGEGDSDRLVLDSSGTQRQRIRSKAPRGGPAWELQCQLNPLPECDGANQV